MTPRRLWLLVAAVCLGLLAAFLIVPSAQGAPVTIANGTQFTDPNGEPVHAHGGGVVKVGEYYYWFGENRND
ncbi:beta-xylosidase, partial [Streptomyces sp. 6N223]